MASLGHVREEGLGCAALAALRGANRHIAEASNSEYGGQRETQSGHLFFLCVK